jgi:peroxisomal 3,2-trans-enoyl-CoA isomerase
MGLIGLQFNRPKRLNAFGGSIILETIAAIRELNEHPDTVFTVLTGEGRFFSAGADVRGTLYLHLKDDIRLICILQRLAI